MILGQFKMGEHQAKCRALWMLYCNIIVSDLIKVKLTKFICRHFLGAAGVFFAFLCIFTLDEDVRNQRRDSIRVFWGWKQFQNIWESTKTKYRFSVVCIQRRDSIWVFWRMKEIFWQSTGFLDTCPQTAEGLHQILLKTSNSLFNAPKSSKLITKIFDTAWTI